MSLQPHCQLMNEYEPGQGILVSICSRKSVQELLLIHLVPPPRSHTKMEVHTSQRLLLLA